MAVLLEEQAKKRPEQPLQFGNVRISRRQDAAVAREGQHEHSQIPKAKWLLPEGADSLALHRSVPVKKALDDAMIALYQNGERIQLNAREEKL